MCYDKENPRRYQIAFISEDNVHNITLSVVKCSFPQKFRRQLIIFIPFFAVHQYDWSPSLFKRVVRDKI